MLENMNEPIAWKRSVIQLSVSVGASVSRGRIFVLARNAERLCNSAWIYQTHGTEVNSEFARGDRSWGKDCKVLNPVRLQRRLIR